MQQLRREIDLQRQLTAEAEDRAARAVEERERALAAARADGFTSPLSVSGRQASRAVVVVALMLWSVRACVCVCVCVRVCVHVCYMP